MNWVVDGERQVDSHCKWLLNSAHCGKKLTLGKGKGVQVDFWKERTWKHLCHCVWCCHNKSVQFNMLWNNPDLIHSFQIYTFLGVLSRAIPRCLVINKILFNSFIVQFILPKQCRLPHKIAWRGISLPCRRGHWQKSPSLCVAKTYLGFQPVAM